MGSINLNRNLLNANGVNRDNRPDMKITGPALRAVETQTMSIDIARMVDAAPDNGVALGGIGAHFGEQQRQAGVAYATLMTNLRIADALERIAAAAERMLGSSDGNAG